VQNFPICNLELSILQTFFFSIFFYRFDVRAHLDLIPEHIEKEHKKYNIYKILNFTDKTLEIVI